MLVVFKKQYLKELYSEGKTTDKHLRFQPNVVKGYQKSIRYLISAKRMEDLYTVNSLHLESLQGDKNGLFSVRATQQYRVEFYIQQVANGETNVTICNITELSNHYK